MLKILVRKLLASYRKENIFFFTCNNIDTYQEIIDIVRLYLEWADNQERKFIFIDEITFVKNWTRAVKHLADIGLLRNCTMIITGSNAHDLHYEIERMPGRRGEDPELDKILFPVSFRDYVSFIHPEIVEQFTSLEAAQKTWAFHQKSLTRCLETLICAYLMRLETTATWSNIVFFFRTTNQVEIDFIVKTKETTLIPIEVKYQEDASPSAMRHLGNINNTKGFLISKNVFQI